ncbi:hypothetical protein [Enterococcus massiliensis]|uniref:hypothetical protein n=1 Tax=Enterococcus massiliensis TaxID=1640685 RepID=UPI00065DF53C|nr:hypothetical protein [Enterococcus massiliensis]
MVQAIKSFQVLELDDGTVRVISSDKRQMARWFGLDYLQDKAKQTQNGNYIALMSSKYRFTPTFRKRN